MTQTSVEQALQIAMQHHQAARLSQAESLYRQILTRQPNHPDALHLLGLIAQQTGRNEIAVDLNRRAINLHPDWFEAHSCLADALRCLGRLDEAIAVYRRAIALRPTDPPAYNSLGLCLQKTGQLGEAIAAYRQAIHLKSDYTQAHNNLGVALRDHGLIDEAIASFGKAVAISPGNAEAHHNLGIAFRDKGLLGEAIASHRVAISLNPRLPQAHASLGSALADMGQIDQAIAAYRQAIAFNPALANAHYNLGKTLMEAGQADEAHKEFSLAVQLEPGNSSFAGAMILSMYYLSTGDASTIAKEHLCWNTIHAQPLRRFTHRKDTDPDRRLRIGYVSPDFRVHPVGRFLLPLLENHDHQQFEIFCYSDVTRSDSITARFQTLADHWLVAASLTHQQLAGRIRADGIDILVDLCGHTTGSRLLVFARKPAPVQVSYLGYPGTTGLTAMDYRLTDILADPPGLTEHLHSETLFRLPQTNWCFAEHVASPAIAPPPPMEHQGYVTFGSFNNFAKVTVETLFLWSRILHEVPDSHLLLKAGAFSAASAGEKTARFFANQGISCDRVTLLGPEPDHFTHLAAYGRVDIALDTFPYHGTATTCDALWMGVPVITLAGKTHLARVGLSLLSNIGLPELVATTFDQYVKIAVDLAGDVHRLKTLRATMREKMRQSPLMNVREFAGNIESAYRQMWPRWCNAD